jgi:indolepyruvate ferredoxin oxidoreductase alpha subunit
MVPYTLFFFEGEDGGGPSLRETRLMLGNEAIARGLAENGCTLATSYPGTPASEILSSLAAWKRECNLALHAQWAINEKVAFEIAYAGSMAGLRTAVSMKQVGLNVASDPLMSAAYMGTRGGFVVISADDPGPHSSQTEQDSRLMAMMAKMPVLDPQSPRQARDMVALAYELSETFQIPVLLRPTTRVCHARQDVRMADVRAMDREAAFERNPQRWAATPRYRSVLHRELEKKLEKVAAHPGTRPVRLNPRARGRRAVIASGVAAAHATEILRDLGLWSRLPFYQVLQPYPVHKRFRDHLLRAHKEVLVLEETTPVIEMQLAQRERVRGKLTDDVPRVGELLPETIQKIVADFAGLKAAVVPLQTAPGRRPTLCAGCPHRAAFFAIKKAAPRGIYTSDIGCYTLGLNLGAVDTVLCMGAAVGQAEGFYHAFKGEKKPRDIVATIGDSTFFHAGIPALIDGVNQRAAFVLVILDNGTTAMTGNQPTPATGRGAGGEPLQAVEIERVVRGCGVTFCRAEDPYRVDRFTAILRGALQHSRTQGPAVLIARRPCPLAVPAAEKKAGRVRIRIDEDCDGCGYCIDHFECPALFLDPSDNRVHVSPLLCIECGVCTYVCPKHNIREERDRR